MNEFNSREIMTLFWMGVALLFFLSKEDIRKSMFGILQAFTNRHILILLGLMLLYITVMVFGLYRGNLWDYSLLKNTIYWSISGAALTVFRSNEAIEDGHYFHKMLKESIGLVVILEFVLNFYDFGLVFEFFSIPTMVFVGLMIGYSEGKKEYKAVHKLMWSILLIYLAVVIYLTARNIVDNYHTLVNSATIVEFLQPPLMTALFVPFLYFLVIFFAYERAFVRINQILKPELTNLAKKKAIRQFGVDRLSMARWVSTLMAMDIKDEDDLQESIDVIKKAKEAEKAPEVVPYDEGWSPYLAREYLSAQGILPGYYNPSFDGSWSAYSQHFPINKDDPVLGNSVEYSIKGTERFARKLKLTLDINDRKTSTEAHEVFAVYCGILIYHALSVELPDNFLRSIKNEKNIQVSINGSRVTLTKHNWAGDKLQRYELHFEVVHPKYQDTSEVIE